MVEPLGGIDGQRNGQLAARSDGIRLTPRHGPCRAGWQRRRAAVLRRLTVPPAVVVHPCQNIRERIDVAGAGDMRREFMEQIHGIARRVREQSAKHPCVHDLQRRQVKVCLLYTSDAADE